MFARSAVIRTHFKSLSVSVARNFGGSAMRSAPVLLDAAKRATHLKALETSGWKMVNGRDAIQKTYNFGNFVEAFGFMTRCALHAEKVDHHPEWFNVYNKVDVTLSTHDCGGLSQLDVDMAQLMDRLSANK